MTVTLDEMQAKMTTAEKRMDGERRLLEELDRIQTSRHVSTSSMSP